jgi:hypothetical protein
MWKDNSILSLVVKDKRSMMKIKILDSFQLLKEILINILKIFVLFFSI